MTFSTALQIAGAAFWVMVGIEHYGQWQRKEQDQHRQAVAMAQEDISDAGPFHIVISNGLFDCTGEKCVTRIEPRVELRNGFQRQRIRYRGGLPGQEEIGMAIVQLTKEAP